MNTIFTKALRELFNRKVQSLIIIVALTLGIVGVGAISNVYTILKREMQKNYDLTNPPHFIANFDSIPSGLEGELRELKPEYSWEYRGIINGRVLCDDGTWKALILEVVPDFNKRNIDKFFPLPINNKSQSGIPTIGSIFIEKAAMPVVKKKIGDKITILIPGSTTKEIAITGIYHAPALPPAWMENWVYGFISIQTAQELTGKTVINQVLFRSLKTIETIAQAQNEAAAMKAWFTQKGIAIKNMTVPVPDAHPHAGQMNSLLYIMQVFGIIALLLSSALVGNIFGSLLARQKREIGIMKSLGATAGKILSINLMQIAMLSSIAILIAVPVGQLFANKYASFTATILNFKIYDSSVPWWGYALQVMVGLGIPIFMVVIQIQSSLQLTIHQILADYGIRSVEKNSLSVRFPVKAGFTPLTLSLRNAFRKKHRMFLMLVSLSAGGILFMVSQNISQSVGVTIDSLFSHYKYDAAFTLSNQSPAGIDLFFLKQKDIKHHEQWSTCQEMVDGREISVYALPGHAAIADFEIDKKDAIVTHAFAGVYKKKVGDTITIETSAGMITRKISAIVTIFGSPAVYINQESLSNDQMALFQPFVVVKYMNSGSKSSISTNHIQKLLNNFKGNKTEQKAGVQSSNQTTRIENELNNKHMVVTDSQNKLEQKESMIAHMRLIASFLMIMSFLSLFVGALTIISSVSLSILERRKEIGVLRAIGTQGTDIIRLFISENVLVGMLSFVIAALASHPISVFAGNVFGMIFLKTSLIPSISHHGLGMWMLLSALLTIVFSYLPSSNASECELRELLNYE